MMTQPTDRPSTHPLGTDGDLRRRLLRHHVPLALATAVVLVLLMTLPVFDATRYPHGDITSGKFPKQRRSQATVLRETRPPLSYRQLTVATGYIALPLLGMTLLVGPANLVLRRRNPISNYLSRDVGTWAATASVVHVIFGLHVHGAGRIRDFLNYFVAPDGSPWTNSFGLANWTGLAAVVIAMGLLAISSDAALRKLKSRRWKRLQRLNYALFMLVILHAVFYGALVRLTSPYTRLLGLTVLAVFAGQAIGIWLWRRRYSHLAHVRGLAAPESDHR